jgi:hypothetical protein
MIMKQLAIGVFEDRAQAEDAISRLHADMNVPTDDISYIYRNADGDVHEVDAAAVTDDAGAHAVGSGLGRGAVIGGTIGALAGLAAVAGVIPVIGPLLAAGPIAAALGFTGAAATTVASAATGAIAGGLVGALVKLGVNKDQAEHYAGRIADGDILVAAYAEEDPRPIFSAAGALETELYALAV